MDRCTGDKIDIYPKFLLHWEKEHIPRSIVETLNFFGIVDLDEEIVVNRDGDWFETDALGENGIEQGGESKKKCVTCQILQLTFFICSYCFI